MPNSIGGISIATNVLANTALLNLNRNQASLATLVRGLSSGLRVSTAADDPSGLAIAVKLNTRASGFDTANLNVQDATNAANVADGALSTIQTILQRIRSLSIEAANTITSFSDRRALQAEVTQLLQEVNAISATTNFNGLALLDGSHAGYQQAVAPSATITSNPQIGTYNTFLQTSHLIASFTIAPTSGLPDVTAEYRVVQINATQQAIELDTFTSQSHGYTSVVLPVGTTYQASGGATVIFNASFTAADVGVAAFVKVLQAVPAASNPNAPAFQFQAGANEGSTISIGLQSVSTSSLRLANINLATTTIIGGVPSTAVAVLGAQDAIGQIDNAVTYVNGARAALGAVITRLQSAAVNNDIASANLTSSASAIRDLNVGQATSEYNREQILVQIGTTVLSQSNTNAQRILGLFR